MPVSMKLKIKCRWRKHVCALYKAFGADAFSTSDADSVVPRRERCGMFSFMRENGTMQIATGERRAHYNTPRKRTYWQFAPKYAEYLKNGGLEELEDE